MLPPELINHILIRLDTQTLLTCRLLSHELNTLILSSPVLQYLIACDKAGVRDNPDPRCTLSYAERLAVLKTREHAWDYVQPQFTSIFNVKHEPSTIYDLTAGAYLLGDSNLRDLHYCRLPSTQGDIPHWTRIHGHGPNEGWDGIVVDMGMAVYEHDLIVNVISSLSVRGYALDLVLLQFSTGTYHPHARHPRINVQTSFVVRPAIALEIVGDNLALAISHRHARDKLFIFDWKSGDKRLQHETAENAYSSLTFVSSELLLVPNLVQAHYEVWFIPPRADGVFPQQILSLRFPALSKGYFMLTLSCRAEPNPSTHGLLPHAPVRPFYAPDDNAIMITNMRVASFPGMMGAAFSLFMHRRALHEMILRLLDVIDDASSQDDEGQGWQYHYNSTVSIVDHDPDRKRQYAYSSFTTQPPSAHDVVFGRTYVVHSIPWSEWGPPISRWFNVEVAQTKWITTTTGQRWALLEPVLATDAEDAEDDGPQVKISLVDFNPYHARWEGPVGDGDELDHQGVFAEDVRMKLACVIRHGGDVYGFDGLMMDEERLLGLESDEEGTSCDPNPKRDAMSADDSRAENWDDDFEFNTRPESSGAPFRRLSVAENWDDDFEDKNETPSRHRTQYNYAEEDEFGFTDKLEDEDQTVTGRLSHLPLRLNSPPPVPHPHSFPRSPSSSVFSLPTTIAGDSVSYGSTAHLYPRSPLPPVKERDRDRERRRLRKKSRPQPQGVFELIPVHQNHSSGLVTLQPVVNGNENRHHSPSPSPARNSTQSETRSRSCTPASTASNTSSTPCSPFSSSPPVPPPMSPGLPGSIPKGAFLSRIASVKNWGVVRRKRGVSQGQTDDTNPSRPTSSLSSLPLSTTSSHQTHGSSNSTAARPTSFLYQATAVGGGCFFRTGDAATSSGYTRGSGTEATEDVVGLDPLQEAPDLNHRGRSADPSVVPGASSNRPKSGTGTGNRTRTPSRSRAPDIFLGAEGPDTPSKLLKRKSLGFVQLRRTLSGFSGPTPAGEELPGMPRTPIPGTPGRHASYGGVVSYKTNGGQLNKSDVFLDREPTSSPPPPLVNKLNKNRSRRQSLSVPMTAIKAKVDAPEQDVGKSLMRSVRRVSLVGGRHRREKSGTAIAPPQLHSQEVKEWPPPAAATFLNLLPPVEIQDTPPIPPLPLPLPLPLLHPVPVSLSNVISVPREEPEIEASADLQTPRKAVLPSSSNNFTTPPSSPKRRGSITKSPTSPQSTSLGRSTYSPTRPEEKSAPRRNSLGDLKIPARISQAQVGLRRDLGMVKEFANSVEQLRELQGVYHALVIEIQALLDDQAHLHAVQQQAARSVSPSFFSRPVGRRRSNTNPPPPLVPPQHLVYKQLASAFYTINSKYRMTWECAELLIELGGGSSSGGGGPAGPATSVSAPVMSQGRVGGDELLSSASSSWAKRKGRERAITLAGDESKPPSPLEGIKMLEGSSSSAALVSPTSFSSGPGTVAWRASTGRQELNQRQMILLKELLNGADSNLALVDRLRPGDGGIPEEPSSSSPPADTSVNREWKWGDPSNSTVTLPPSECSGGGAGTRPSSMAGVGVDGKNKRPASKLGMAGLRDLLKMLKRHYTAHPVHPMPSFGSIPPSTSSLASATNSSSDIHQQHSGGGYPSSSSNLAHGERPVTYGRRRAKTSFGPESLTASTLELYDDATTPLPVRQRGRPSLAAIFRIPNPLKPSKVSSVQLDSAADEDWDRVDSVELDKAAKKQSVADEMTTVRGKGRSPYLQQAPPSSFGGGGGRVRRSPSRSSNRQPRPTAESSQTSLYEDSPSSSSHHVMLARLSNVDEDGGGSGCGAAQARAPSRPPPSPSSSTNAGTPLTPPPRASSRYYGGKPKGPKNGSVRSMPPQPMPELRLAMTPENIKPLVENAKEVHATLVECIAEIRSLLENHRLAPVHGR
ncbi:hypothetical protein APHAL10511_004962 [Amanita phalloides]|nr:hypothetical protein APHAL10511_004962 [Amanita phalloides]